MQWRSGGTKKHWSCPVCGPKTTTINIHIKDDFISDEQYMKTLVAKILKEAEKDI